MKSGSGKNVATRTISHPQPCSPVSRPNEFIKIISKLARAELTNPAKYTISDDSDGSN